jgi:macrodomain Ter protein organizer (MatP/YcbG family)
MTDKQAWHQAIEKINQDLRNTLSDTAVQLISHRQQLEKTQNERTLLQSREFPFLLFPLKTLVTLLETGLNTP